MLLKFLIEAYQQDSQKLLISVQTEQHIPIVKLIAPTCKKEEASTTNTHSHD